MLCPKGRSETEHPYQVELSAEPTEGSRSLKICCHSERSEESRKQKSAPQRLPCVKGAVTRSATEGLPAAPQFPLLARLLRLTHKTPIKAVSQPKPRSNSAYPGLYPVSDRFYSLLLFQYCSSPSGKGSR